MSQWLSRTGLTGRVDRSDRYSWAERGKLGFVGVVSWKIVWLIVSGNFYESCMHSHIICICIRVAAAAEEVVYEVVAEP